MRIALSTLLILSLCGMVCGCGGGSGSNSSSPISMAGNWQFTAKSSFGPTASAVGNIAQSGQNLSGQFTLSGTPCASAASMAGTISGNSLNIGLNEDNQIVSFVGILANDGNSACLHFERRRVRARPRSCRSGIPAFPALAAEKGCRFTLAQP